MSDPSPSPSIAISGLASTPGRHQAVDVASPAAGTPLLQLDSLDSAGGPISSVLEFMDGASLIDFADTHPRPHLLVFESPNIQSKYFKELESKHSFRDCLESLERLFSKPNRGKQYEETIVGVICRLWSLMGREDSEVHVAFLLPRMNMFVENLAWCHLHPEDWWGELLAPMTAGALCRIPDSSDYRAAWEIFFQLSGTPLLLSATKRYAASPRVRVQFIELFLRALTGLAEHVSASHETILESGIFQLLRACVELRRDNHDLDHNFYAWKLVVALMTSEHHETRDGVRLQVLETEMIPHLISSMSSSTDDIYVGTTLKVLILLSKPSQHFARIQQSFLSAGGVEMVLGLIRRYGQERDEINVWKLRTLISQILPQVQQVQQG